jgi:hypothetical protein
MIRTLDLAQWAGQWVAVDDDGHVHAAAAELADVIADVKRRHLEGVAVMRAPVPGEPIVFGLG